MPRETGMRARGARRYMELAASVFSHAREGITITDENATILDVNHAFTRITGYSREEAVGRNPRFLKSGRHDRSFYDSMWDEIEAKGYWEGEIWNRRRTGELYAAILTISRVLDRAGTLSHYVAVFSDISAQKLLEQQLRHVAHYDVLTGLPNRVLFNDRLNQALASARCNSAEVAIAFIDIDGFKAVNDKHGHSVGDRLLLTLAERIRSCLREEDTVARFGGDEFIALLGNLNSTSVVPVLLDRLLVALSQPVNIEGQEHTLSASIGYTVASTHEVVDGEQLVRQADHAMYQAKLTGKNRFHAFDARQMRQFQSKVALRAELAQAIHAGELELFYQPKVSMSSGKAIGVEALLRWNHPEKGYQAPDSFLPAAENTPLDIAINKWVLHAAMSQIERWFESGIHLPISINVTCFHLQKPNFLEDIREILSAHPNAPLEYVELEILESSALKDLAHVAHVISECRKLGMRVSLDDFGSGYSSLTYLKHLPVDTLKLDQSFVRGILNDRNDVSIVEGVLALAAAFQRSVVVEGVETEAHSQILLKLGCNLAQGYSIARPMPAGSVPGWLAGWQPPTFWQHPSSLTNLERRLLFSSLDQYFFAKQLENALRDASQNALPLERIREYNDTLASFGKEEFAANGFDYLFEQFLRSHEDINKLRSHLLALHETGATVEAISHVPMLRRRIDDLTSSVLQAFYSHKESAGSCSSPRAGPTYSHA